jgi:hypothetical protein
VPTEFLEPLFRQDIARSVDEEVNAVEPIQYLDLGSELHPVNGKQQGLVACASEYGVLFAPLLTIQSRHFDRKTADFDSLFSRPYHGRTINTLSNTVLQFTLTLCYCVRECEHDISAQSFNYERPMGSNSTETLAGHTDAVSTLSVSRRARPVYKFQRHQSNEISGFSL